MLEGVVPDEINKRVVECIEAYEGNYDPFLKEDWFVENVLLNPQAAGAVRSLLGENFALPIGIANHRVVCPSLAQNWHHDGASRYGPELNHLQVFYYPQDCPKEMGPTEVVPGSHFVHSLQSWMAHYGSIGSAVKMVAPAGSIFITVYPIWHRRSKSTAKGCSQYAEILLLANSSATAGLDHRTRLSPDQGQSRCHYPASTTVPVLV